MTARIGTDPAEAARLLQEGGVVAIPTETVYGLAANAFDADVVLRVFEVKRRPAFDPLIVHVGSAERLEQVVTRVPDQARRLIERFWPGPLTLVLPKTGAVPDVVTSGLDTVGVRMPWHPLALELLRALDFPLAAPSANPFGYVSPTTAQHVMDQLGHDIPYILDGGPCSVGVESTIVGWENGAAVLYRAGGVPLEMVQEVIGPVRTAVVGSAPPAPGMLASHYAPRKRMLVGDVERLRKEHRGARLGIISFTAQYGAYANEVLSPSGELHEAARNLFAAMRRLDAGDADLLIAEVFPEEGLGHAINDRLRRASASR
jgi:L-threonylcarbamoyladenylate synthase